MTFLEVTLLIHEERERQIAKWGDQHHAHIWWLGILVEEVGEIAKVVVETQLNHEADRSKDIINEIIHATAVGMAWLEDKLGEEGG